MNIESAGNVPVSFLLDQNFPLPILVALRPYLPPHASYWTIGEKDASLAEVDDWELVIRASRLGMAAVVTNDYNMLRQPGVLLAARWGRISIVAIESLGHDPIRATGAFLLDLTAIARRIAKSDKALVFRVNHQSPGPIPIQDEFKEWAESQGRPARDLVADQRAFLASQGVGRVPSNNQAAADGVHRGAATSGPSTGVDGV